MRESDESDDRRTASANGDVEPAARRRRDGESQDVEAMFESGPLAPSVVEASVDALFERFEEDSPEEVMLADRFPDDSEVVPTPPAFDEFAEDVAAEDVADADSPVGFETARRSSRGDESLPAPEDVVGFEDAPEPRESEDVAGFEDAPDPCEREDAGDGSGVDSPAGVDSSASEDSRAGDGSSFEWVRDPVVTETVLADPAVARTFAGGESSEEEESAGVLSGLRSSFPF